MPVIQVPSTGGYSTQGIIDRATDLTERKGNMNRSGVFLDALQELCLETRWHWRKKRANFTCDGDISYDLTDESVVGEGNAALFFSKFLKKGVRLSNTAGDLSYPEAIFEEDRQEDLLEFGESNPGGTPGGYFLVPGEFCTIHFDRPPDSGLLASAWYWALPNLDYANLPTSVPLVPGNLHHLLIKGMVRRIYAVLVAQGAANYATAKKAADDDYLYYLNKAKGLRDFADGRIREYSDQSEEAVTSTAQ